jgi:DNA invertase Pin-like site-specific DNA recombinase
MMEMVFKNDRSVDLKEVKMLRVEQLYKNGFPIASACKMTGISVHTYYKWRRNSQIDVRENIAPAVLAAKAEQ